MKKFLVIALLSITFSCKRGYQSDPSDTFSYALDTLTVHSKDRTLDLESDLLKSALIDSDESILIYNRFDHALDKVNLKELAYEATLPLEGEGENGTGWPLTKIQALGDNRLFLKSAASSSIFDKKANRVLRIDWPGAFDSTGYRFGHIPPIEVATTHDNLKIFGLSFDRKERLVFLDVLSVPDNRVKRFDIDTERSYSDFVLAVEDPEAYSYLDPVVYLSNENDLMIVSHQFSNELFLFDANGQFVRTVNYEPKLTPKRARNPNRNTLASSEELSEAYQSLLEQVRFGPPVWDSVGKRYFRLSAKRAFSEKREVNAFLPEQTDIKIYLTVFDSGFNLVSELLIPELDHETGKYFAKDGKLWVFRNLSDELGFIIVELL